MPFPTSNRIFNFEWQAPWALKRLGSDPKWFRFHNTTLQRQMLCIFQRESCLRWISYISDLDYDQMVLLLNLDLFLTAVRKVRPAHWAPVCPTLSSTINIAMHSMHKMHKAVQNAHNGHFLLSGDREKIGILKCSAMQAKLVGSAFTS